MKKLLVVGILISSVSAVAMTRQEYNDYRDWLLPPNENGADEGYLIVDAHGEKNTPDYDGYVQWLPKSEFDRKFKPSAQNHVERMQDEKNELDTKLNALKSFLAKLDTDEAPLLTDEQVNSLELQAKAMKDYSDILGYRIEYDTEYLNAIGG